MNIFFYRFCQLILYCIFRTWNRYEIIGAEHIRKGSRGFILASNHVSFLDPPVIGSRIWRHVTFLAKEKLFKKPVLGCVIRLLGAVPIAGESDFRSLRRVIRHLKKGEIVSIFPEGTRTSTDNLDEIKQGVVFLSHVTGALIVPCYIDGTDRALGRGYRWMRPEKIRVFIGEPFQVEAGSANKQMKYQHGAEELSNRVKLLKNKAKRANV